MSVTEEQQHFLEQLALRIPRLFDAIRQGNVKCEFIIGVRDIDERHVRLKLVAEVVDSGANPLKTHSALMRSHSKSPEPQTLRNLERGYAQINDDDAGSNSESDPDATCDSTSDDPDHSAPT